MTSVTHVAGPVVSIRADLGHRVLQRCVICGEKLCDNLNSVAPLNPDGTLPIFPVWQQGCYVQIEGNRASMTGSFIDQDPIPDDFCLELVEQ